MCRLFETYQKARLVFVQTMADLATRATNVKCLESAGVLDLLRPLLSDGCSTVRQCAVMATARLAEHDESVAQQLLSSGMLTITIENLNNFNVYYKRSALYLIRAIAKHNEDLASTIVRLVALEHIVSCLEDFDTQRSTLCALGAVAGARAALGEAVVAGGALPPALLHAGHDTAPVRRAAACLLRDIVKHSVDLAQLVVNTGGCGPLVELLSENTGGTRVPACMALGYIAGQSDQLAMAVIEVKAVVVLVEILQNNGDDADLCAAAWTLGHIAKHSPQHSLAIAVANALPRLLQLYTNPKSSGEVKARSLCALKQSLQCCLHRPALEPLLHAAPACVLKYVLAQYAKILPNDARARRLFVTTGALKRVQEIDTVPGTSLKEYINIINSCFPEEIVRYYTPGYSDSLLDRVEAYTPQIPELFTDRVPSDCQSELTLENGN
nr:sperm-associated antigen 6-like isoform X2 [Vanessa tameamea]